MLKLKFYVKYSILKIVKRFYLRFISKYQHHRRVITQGGTFMNEMKHVGNFLYQYLEDNTVSIAYMACLSNLAGQMLVHKRMDDKSKWTGQCIDGVYKGSLYIFLIFESIPEEDLVKVLQA